MTIQVLVSTMHRTDHDLLKQMNIQTDAIVINQCDRDEIERFEYNGHKIIWMSFNERGVGLSRNNALMRATAEVVVFADDDVVYEDGYEEKIINAFEKHKNAEMLILGMKHEEETDSDFYKKRNKDYVIHFYNSLHYGTCSFACKRKMLLDNNILFNLKFGGGAKYSCGEDSIFLTDVLKKHKRVVCIKEKIGIICQNGSTWFNGYNEKYVYDKGVLMGTISGPMAYVLMLLLIIKNKEQYKTVGFTKAVKLSFGGIKSAIVKGNDY